MSEFGCFGGLATALKNVMIDLKVTQPDECIGVISSVKEIPEESDKFLSKCCHIIELTDGSQYVLKFSDIKFDQIQHHLQLGNTIRITFKKPNNKIVNIYPQPVYQNMEMHKLIQNTDPDQLVRVRLLNGEIKTIDFI